MNILHIIPGYGGGIGSIVLNLICHSSSDNISHDVALFSCENGADFVEKIESLGGHVYMMPRPKVKGLHELYIFLKDIFTLNRYDVVHCHTSGWRALLFRTLIKRFSNPIICVHAHRAANNPGIIQNNKLYIKFEQLCSRMAADIKFSCGKLASEFIFGDSSSICVHNGVDVERISKARNTSKEDYCKSLNLCQNELILLSVGRYTQQKNYPFLLEIIKELKTRNVKFKLLAVGTGPLHEQIKEEARKLRIDSDIIFLGRRSDVFNLMSIANILLLPSLYEGLPTVVIEAQAMGLKTFAADTITKEADLRLNLVQFIPINNQSLWVDAIESNTQIDEITYDMIDNVLQEQHYTAESSAQSYIDVLQKHT